MSVDMKGNLETIQETPGPCSGLGWLPDGRLLIVSMLDRRLLRMDVDGLSLVADLMGLATYHCNDMVVDRSSNISGKNEVGNGVKKNMIFFDIIACNQHFCKVFI